MAEGARLESVYTGNRIEGSNPSVSANKLSHWNRKQHFLFTSFKARRIFPSMLVSVTIWIDGCRSTLTVSASIRRLKDHCDWCILKKWLQDLVH